MPRRATLHPGLEARILCDGIEAGAVLVDVGEVAVAEDAGIGVSLLQTAKQSQQRTFLHGCSGVVGVAPLVQSSLVAHAETVLVVASGMCPHEVLVARLVGRPVACDVVVVAREPEPLGMVPDELCHRIRPVTARRGTVNDDEVDCTHTTYSSG